MQEKTKEVLRRECNLDELSQQCDMEMKEKCYAPKDMNSRRALIMKVMHCYLTLRSANFYQPNVQQLLKFV